MQLARKFTMLAIRLTAENLINHTFVFLINAPTATPIFLLKSIKYI